MGYSPNHKGYKCLHVSTGRVYISRNVVFDDSNFPFAKPNPPVMSSNPLCISTLKVIAPCTSNEHHLSPISVSSSPGATTTNNLAPSILPASNINPLHFHPHDQGVLSPSSIQASPTLLHTINLTVDLPSLPPAMSHSVSIPSSQPKRSSSSKYTPHHMVTRYKAKSCHPSIYLPSIHSIFTLYLLNQLPSLKPIGMFIGESYARGV